MITAETVLKHGRTGGDEALLPRDEYLMRIHAVRTAMSEVGLDSLVIVDQAVQSGHVAYLAGPIEPRAALVLTADEEPIVLADIPPRDFPSFCSQTWITDVRTVPGFARNPGEVLSASLGELIPKTARIGIDGVELPGYVTSAAEEIIDRIRRPKRPWERYVMQLGYQLARRAVETAVELYVSGASNGEAALEAEHVARLGGAFDVRVLANIYGNQLAPQVGMKASRRDNFSIVCAVAYRGYWAEFAGTVPLELSSIASAAVDAMMLDATPGKSAHDVANSGLALLPVAARDRVLSYGVGGGIGISSDEAPSIGIGSEGRIEQGDVVVLRAIVPLDDGLFASSRMVHIERSGAIEL